jgi:hypothetical protein
MPRKEFEAFTRLDASDVNSFLMDQSVMTFASSAARGSAIATPVEGMTSFLEDSNILSIYDGSNWKTSLATTGGILQVVQSVKTDTFTTSTGSFVAVTGLSATITPKSASNKILVLAQISYGLSNNAVYGAFRLYGGTTDLYIGAAAGSRTRAVFGGYTLDDQGLTQLSSPITYLASPNTTSQITIGVEVASQDGIGTVFVNRSRGDGDADNAPRVRGASSITLMEVAA